MSNLHEKCATCTRVKDNDCAVYPNPAYWWEKRKGCPLATHIHKRIVEDKKVNPLKASKRNAKKKK